MHDEQTSWDAEEFETEVAGMLVSMFETKIKNEKRTPISSQVDSQKLFRLRQFGPYIPSGDRLIIVPKENENLAIDVVNDPIPSIGCYSHGSVPGKAPHIFNGYAVHYFFEEANSMPKEKVRMGHGRLFKLIAVSAENDHIKGLTEYFTVSKSGLVAPCDTVLQSSLRGEPGQRTYTISEYDKDPERMKNIAFAAFATMQFQSDRRFCWQIKAEESKARAYFGVGMNEIKSLLYARTLPQTETGRKRPILHMVNAHQRRMKNGTDIDVKPFLRGIQKVEIGGTLFTVIPPKVMRVELSENSERYRKERTMC